MAVSQKGFTFIELTLVLGITTLLVLMGSGISSAMVNNVETRVGGARLVEALHQASQYARSKGQCVAIEIRSRSLEIKGYRQSNCAEPNGSSAMRALPLTRFKESIELSSSQSTIVLDSFGAPISPEPVQITFKDRDQKRLITIFPVSGLVRMGAVQSFESAPPARGEPE